jgi:hypothetical protein
VALKEETNILPARTEAQRRLLPLTGVINRFSSEHSFWVVRENPRRSGNCDETYRFESKF